MLTELMSSAAALAFVLALMGLMVWLIKRAGLMPGHVRPGKGGKQIKVVETQMIDARTRLVVVRWHGREYLLASGAGGVTRIAKTDTAFDSLIDKDGDQTA